jgi:hypothetical protein
MLTKIFSYVRDHSDIPDDEDKSFNILMPKISLRDLQRSGGAMLRASQALQLATKNGWVDAAQAREVFLALVDQLALGIEIRSPELPEVLK